MNTPPLSSPELTPPPGPTPRRGFLVKVAAILSAGLAFVVPSVLAVVYAITPLFRKKSSGAGNDPFLFVGRTGGLVPGGPPQLFQVFGARKDGWTTHPQIALGSVLARLDSEGNLTCFNARCPHLGCTVGFQAARDEYYCPCHAAAFNLEGVRQNHVPPRNLDQLEAEIRNGNELWVKFQNFRNGMEQKVPV